MPEESDSGDREGRPVLDADEEPVFEEERRLESEPVLDAADEPAPEPAAEEAAALEAEGVGQASEPVAPAFQQATEPDDDEEPAEPVAAEAHQEPAEASTPDTDDEPVGEGVHDGPVEHVEPGVHDEPLEHPEHEHPVEPVEHVEHVVEGERELPELIEAAFAGLDDKSWAVAQNRVFTDQPSAVDQLAKLFAVPPADISATEHELRLRLDQWLASEEAAPYRAHLDELRKTLGPAAPKEQLIGAADWHAREIRALEVPAWQFVLATMPSQAQSQPQSQALSQPQPQARPESPVEFQQHSAFGPMQPPPPPPPPPPPGPPQFQAFTPVAGESNGGSEQHKPYQPLKDVSQTRRCFRQPDGRWWLRIDVTGEQLAGGECALPTGFAAYLGLSPGETRAVRSAAGELTMTWHGRPVLESIERLLVDVGAKEGGHLFLTLSDEGVLRARHLPVAAQNAENITKALRLVGYTAPGGTRDQAARVIATRIGLTGSVGLPDLLTRLRERGDRDLLALLD
ncbi:MAG: hypothetical protein HOW71_09975 [Nonomuraea sp.]|nr:hypothetical protein [Nonomuraea sp.]